MGNKINPIRQVFLLLIISALVHPIFAQETGNASTATLVQIECEEPKCITQEEILIEAQRSFDRSLSILGIVATSLGVLVALLTLIIIIAIACGIFEYRRWRGIRKEIEEEAKVVKNIRKKAEDDMSKLEEELKNHVPPLTEKPSKEIEEKLGELDKKIEILEMLGTPLKAEDYFNRGVGLYHKEKYEEALKAFEKAIELNPDKESAWNNKGATLSKLERYDEALKAHEKAIELNPNHIMALSNKGIALSNLERYDEALKAFEKAIELNPDDEVTWNNKGVTLDEYKRYDEALKAYEKAIELNPDKESAWNNKGATLSNLERYDEALKAFEKAIELSPDYDSAWFNKACAYSLKEDKKNMLDSLSKAIELNSKNKEDAKTDEDFKKYRKDPDFKKLVE
jgi:tetratricopeptide (TPR) repeat protein